jgi:cytochrome c-type biogenesis protein
MEFGFTFMFAAFIAGLITFLAPCTLPLVPGYLGFISGVSTKDLQDPQKAKTARRTILKNGIAFVVGFSVVFIVMGLLLGLLGQKLAFYQVWLTRIGGLFVIVFGLFMLGIFKLPMFHADTRMKLPSFLHVGSPGSSFTVGAAFAFGWSPCVGPVLGGVLALATVSSTALQGAFLLFAFSLGLAVPFILVALLFSSATAYIAKIAVYMKYISFVGGLILIFVGVLLVMNDFTFLIEKGFQLLEFLGIEGYENALLKFL